MHSGISKAHRLDQQASLSPMSLRLPISNIPRSSAAIKCPVKLTIQIQIRTTLQAHHMVASFIQQSILQRPVVATCPQGPCEYNNDLSFPVALGQSPEQKVCIPKSYHFPSRN